MEKADWIWHNGEMLAWDAANVHLTTHSLHYGFAAFEGIRCYAQASGGGGVFRLVEHVNRLYDTAHICMLDVPYHKEKVVEACKQVVRDNQLHGGCYIRPIVYMGAGQMGIAAMDSPIHVAVMAWKWGAYLGEDGVKNGIRVQISSFRRPRGDALLAKGKITGQYVNSILAKREAIKSGYDEAIMLDSQGYVSEGTGENLFWVRGGEVFTPPVGETILDGITRGTVVQLLRDDGIRVHEAMAGRDDLYLADEIFLTGTAAEVTPVREIDHRTVADGRPGSITKKLQETYAKTVAGELDPYRSWITLVE